MKTRSLAFRTGLAIALGIALGHLWSMNLYELDRIAAAASTHALKSHKPGNVLLGRRLMSGVAGVAIVGLGLLAGTGWAETIVTCVAAYAAMGLVVGVERAALGYAGAAWPLVPWSIKQPAATMSGIFLVILVVCIFMVRREALAHKGGKPSRQEARRRSSVRRTRSKPKAEPAPADDEEEFEGASSED